MELTILAFKDPPMWSGVTQITSPLNQCVVGLDHLEQMRTVVRGGTHDASFKASRRDIR